MKTWFVLVLLILQPLACVKAERIGEKENSVLEIAKRIGSEKFLNFSYGSDTSKKQIDCVQFLGFVVEEKLGRPLSPEEKKILFINYHFKDLNKAVSLEDPKTQGVTRLLTEVLNAARFVNPHDANKGDLIQYWIKKKNENWLGHCAIVSDVWKDQKGNIRISLYGAHKSINGVAENNFSNEGLNISNPNRKIYISRFKNNTTNKIMQPTR